MATNVGPETSNYRYYRRMAWQVTRSRFAAALVVAVLDSVRRRRC